MPENRFPRKSLPSLTETPATRVWKSSASKPAESSNPMRMLGISREDRSFHTAPTSDFKALLGLALGNNFRSWISMVLALIPGGRAFSGSKARHPFKTRLRTDDFHASGIRASFLQSVMRTALRFSKVASAVASISSGHPVTSKFSRLTRLARASRSVMPIWSRLSLRSEPADIARSARSVKATARFKLNSLISGASGGI